MVTGQEWWMDDDGWLLSLVNSQLESLQFLGKLAIGFSALSKVPEGTGNRYNWQWQLHSWKIMNYYRMPIGGKCYLSRKEYPHRPTGEIMGRFFPIYGCSCKDWRGSTMGSPHGNPGNPATVGPWLVSGHRCPRHWLKLIQLVELSWFAMLICITNFFAYFASWSVD